MTTGASPYPGLEGGAPRTNDPGFQPPADPLSDLGALEARVRVIHREIPNVTVQSGWSVSDVRSAIIDLSAGLFDAPSQLYDAIAGDSRVQSALRSRSGGLLGRTVRFRVPDRLKDDKTAQHCKRAFERHWPQMSAEPALGEMVEVGGGIGFAFNQLVWDTGSPIWKPYLLPFNTRFSYFHWLYRIYVAVTQDGQVPITPGDGHWVLHAPYGSYRGWMRGALRALAQWWLARNYALRDWARYCERHGFPILLFDTPFGADPDDISAGQAQLQGLGQESILQVPGSVDVTKFGKYDLRYLEPKDENWQAFKDLISQCNDEITLALLGQNLTSQVKEGSFAAARVHADVRQAIIEADARALAKTVYLQIARPFAALNFGDAKYAPLIEWDVRADEDLKTKAQTFQSFSSALQQLRNAGFALDNPERFARKFGLVGLKLREVPPMQIEAQLARATGQMSTKDDPMPDATKAFEDEDDEDDSKPPAASASTLSSAVIRSDYNPDQPRDSDGKFGSGGVGKSSKDPAEAASAAGAYFKADPKRQQRIEAYTQSYPDKNPQNGYRAINQSLRNGKPSAAAKRLSADMKAAPKFDGETHRGTILPLDIAEHWQDIANNGFLTKSESFWSSSREQNTAHSFMDLPKPGFAQAMLHIKSKSGVSLEGISRVPGEKEVLIPPHTEFRIGHVEKQGSVFHIHLEEVE